MSWGTTPALPTSPASSAPHEVLRHQHDVLVDALTPLGLAARELPGLDGDDVRDRVDSALAYLHDDVLRHAHAEDMALLPALEHSTPGGTSAAGSLHAEHDTVRVAAAQLGELALRPLTPPTVADLAGLLGGVHALLERHFDRETDIYTPLVEGMDAQGQQRLQSRLLALGEARPDVVHRPPDELPIRMPARRLPIQLTTPRTAT